MIKSLAKLTWSCEAYEVLDYLQTFHTVFHFRDDRFHLQIPASFVFLLSSSGNLPEFSGWLRHSLSIP